MDIFLTALDQVFSFGPIAAIIIGTFFGIIIGAIPGLGSVVGISICLPFTFGMDAITSISLLLGVYCGSVYGGSISAVMINSPGTPQSAATVLEGYPMAQAGQAGKQGGLAAAVGADDGADLAAGDRQVERVDDQALGIAHAQFTGFQAHFRRSGVGEQGGKVGHVELREGWRSRIHSR